MTKFLRLVLAMCIATILHFTANAQSVSINTTGAVAAPSAILDVTSTLKGVLVPRMDKPAKNLIAAPANGLLVYQTGPDSIGFHYYDQPNTRWVYINASGFATDTTAWKITGNSNITSNNFLGTTNDSALRFRVRNKPSGIVDSASANTALGFQSLANITSGVNNTVMGVSALRADTSGSNNTAIGLSALRNKVRGSNNVAIGVQASFLADTVSNTTAIGRDALYYNKHHNNFAVGFSAGANVDLNPVSSPTTEVTYLGTEAGYGFWVGSKTTGVGYRALWNYDTQANIIWGSGIGRNTAIGDSAMALTYASRNVAVGTEALSRARASSQNVAIGDSSMGGALNTVGNVAIGYKTLSKQQGQGYNTAVGYFSQRDSSKNTIYNTSIGAFSMEYNRIGVYNTGLGLSALRLTDSASYNTAVGTDVMYNHRKGDLNTAMGHEAMQNDSAGALNVAMGWRALRNNKIGAENTAVGVGALEFDSSGSFNTAVGRYAGFLNKRGNYNVAMGMQAAVTNDTASYTTLIGYQAGYYNRSNYNTAIGAFALTQNNFTTGAATTGIENTGIGYGAGYLNNLGSQNTAVGHQAMRGVSTYISGNRNVAVGDSAMTHLSSGFNNTALGSFALRHDSSGSNNVAIGYRAADSARNTSAVVAIGSLALTFNRIDSNVAIGYRAGGRLGANLNYNPREATLIGNWAGDGAFASHKNTALGFRALTQRAPNGQATDYIDGGRNTAIGDSAMANTVGISNVVIGAQALPTGGVGVFNNVAIGDSAMGGASLVNDNVAIGYHSLKNSNYVTSSNTGNTAIGAYTGGKITSGYYNTISGYFAMENATTAAGVTAIGTSSFRNNISGFDNVGVGINSGLHVTSGANTYTGSYAGEGALGLSTGGSNTGTGYFALSDIRSGFSNTAMGRQALAADTSGSYNVAIGQNAMLTNLASDFNTAVGYNSLLLHKRAGFTYNTGLGSFALEQDSSGYQNTGVGTSAFRFNKTGILNTGIGINAGYYQKESFNTFVGGYSGFGERSSPSYVTADTGNYNTGLGAYSLYQIANGNNNVAVGYSALRSDSIGDLNTAVGNGALYSNTGSHTNQAFGWNALYNYDGTGFGYNNAFGDLALQGLTSGTQNVAMGSYAMLGHTTGQFNTAVGNYVMGGGAGGNNNTALGASALFNTSANGNVGIGFNTGTTNTTGTNNTFIGNSANPTTGALTNATAIGFNATVAQSNSLVLGQAGTSVGIGTTTPGASLDVSGTFALGANGTVLTQIVKQTINTVTIPAVGANTTTFADYAVPNAILGGSVVISPSTALPTGVIIGFARVISTGNVRVTYANITGTPSSALGPYSLYITVIN